MLADFSLIDELLDKLDKHFDPSEYKTVYEEIRTELKLSANDVETWRNRMEGKDPFSLGYLQDMKEIHSTIVRYGDREKYHCKDEGLFALDIDREAYLGLPFETQDYDYVGEYLEAYGFIIRNMKLPPRHSILEPGCGLGSFTEFLVRMGYRVDAVDVNKEHCMVVQKKIEHCTDESSRVICNDIESFLQTEAKSYDAVLFFESFHHLMNHYKILQEIISKHLNDDGIVVLAGEPVIEDIACTGEIGEILPYPWGCRLDGESLFQMRKRGWLELGFRESYIRAMCDQLGLFVEHKINPQNIHSSMYILSKKDFGDDNGFVKETDSGEYTGTDLISRNRVIDAYHFFLGREPESEEAIKQHLMATDIYALIDNFMEAEEFRKGIGRNRGDS